MGGCFLVFVRVVGSRGEGKGWGLGVEWMLGGWGVVYLLLYVLSVQSFDKCW